MRTCSISCGVVWLLAISLAVTPMVQTPAMATVFARDPNYNGIWQDWGSGWQYCYFSAGDYAWWKINGNSRLEYQYTNQQWRDCDKFGTWRTMGANGVSDSWIGDGAWHNLNSGWYYLFSVDTDTGTWRLGNASGPGRFRYLYGDGTWEDMSSYNGGNWYRLSSQPTTAEFIGDGTWHTLSPAWAFSYDSSADIGTWRRQVDGAERFRYVYSTGDWQSMSAYNKGNWNDVYWTGMGISPWPYYSSVFIGDGGWHDRGTASWSAWVPWYYSYDYASDSEQWRWGLVRLEFKYTYGIGQFSHYDAISSSWRDLGSAGKPNKFWPTGSWDLGNGWNLQFNLHNFSGQGDSYEPVDIFWNGSGNWWFEYRPGMGQWYYQWVPFGSSGLSEVFIFDGAQYNLNNGLLFAYESDTETLKFYRDATGTPLRFSWNNRTGQWTHYDARVDAPMPGFSLYFLSAFSPYVQSGYYDKYYARYDPVNDDLAFWTSAGYPPWHGVVYFGTDFLKYSYATHRWYDRRAIPDAAWCVIPTGGVGVEIEKAYWTGGSYKIGMGKQIQIDANYVSPVETITGSARSGYSWKYTYVDGTWSLWNGTTYTVLATDANPDLYRWGVRRVWWHFPVGRLLPRGTCERARYPQEEWHAHAGVFMEESMSHFMLH